MLIGHSENKSKACGKVTPCSLVASYQCFRITYCLYLEGRRVSHVRKQGIGMGKKGKAQGCELVCHNLKGWDPRFYVPEHCRPRGHCSGECKVCFAGRAVCPKFYTFGMDWPGPKKIGCHKCGNIPHEECINVYQSISAYIQNSCVVVNDYFGCCLFMLSYT